MSLGDAGHSQEQVGDWLEPLDGPVDSDLGWTQEPSRTRSGGQVRGAHLGAGCGDGLPDLHRRDDPRPGSCHHSGGWEASGSGLSSRRCSVPAAAPRALGRPGRPALLLALPALFPPSPLTHRHMHTHLCAHTHTRCTHAQKVHTGTQGHTHSHTDAHGHTK